MRITVTGAGESTLSLMLVFAGTLTAALTHELLVTICVAAGAFLKGWMDFKKVYLQLKASCLACSIYFKALTCLKCQVLFGDVDLKAFWIEMETLGGVVGDFASPLSDELSAAYEKRFLVDDYDDDDGGTTV